MATTLAENSNQLVDTAIGAVNVVASTVQDFDVDDFVSSTVVSMAVTIDMYNKASSVSSRFTQNRRVVSVGGVTVGGY